LAERDGSVPRVSVIIPCYNGERFVGDAIESVLDQTYRDLEVVVVDDSSTDGSPAVVRGYLSDGRVNLVRHDVNRGIPATRNTGIASSAGEFVSFLDQDDSWAREKLDRQIRVFDASALEVGIVFSDVLMVDDDGASLGLSQGREIPRRINDMSREARLRALFRHNFMPLISVLVRRRCLDEVGWFDEGIRGGMDDYELCLRLVAGCDVRAIREPLATHRVHAANYSENTERLIADAPGIIERALAEHPFLSELMPRKMAVHHFRLARYHRDRGDAARARAELRRSIASDRSWIKPYVSYVICSIGRLGRSLVSARRRMRRPRP
jgi:glycosyltransferase involved in cell wall biosynthesis